MSSSRQVHQNLLKESIKMESYTTNRLEKTLVETHNTLRNVCDELFNQAIQEKDVFYRQILNEVHDHIFRAIVENLLIYDRCLITQMFEEE